MKRMLHRVATVLASRAVSPVVIGLFLLVYIGIAFFTEEALTTLIAFTGSSIFLAVLFALLPLNSLARLLLEADRQCNRHKAMAGRMTDVPERLFDESVVLTASTCTATGSGGAGTAPFEELEGRLGAVGYKTRRTENVLAAWKGWRLFPARMLYLVATFCLFAGILISLTFRTSNRGVVVEGEPMPSAGGEMVERIVLRESYGWILSKALSMEVAPSTPGNRTKTFGIYPPSLDGGAFVYPRYLGIGLLVRFYAPDIPGVYENNAVLNIYPPGKEDAVAIPESPYRITFSLTEPDDGSDPYVSGKMSFAFKVAKGKEILFAGKAPAGGEFVHDGYRLVLPDARRLVITDFIRDYGVPLIWGALLFFTIAAGTGLPLRIFIPRREMLFVNTSRGIHAFSRSEGNQRGHDSIFHESLDLLEGGKREGLSQTRAGE